MIAFISIVFRIMTAESNIPYAQSMSCHGACCLVYVSTRSLDHMHMPDFMCDPVSCKKDLNSLHDFMKVR